MRLADIYCQPNLKAEPFGIAIAEAMRAGLPCVISGRRRRCRTARRIVRRVTAPGDADAVAAALQRLAADPTLSGEWVAAAVGARHG